MKKVSLTTISLLSLVLSVCSANAQTTKNDNSLTKLYDRLANHETRISSLERKGGASVQNQGGPIVTTRSEGSYTVKNGDTISGIARSQRVSTASLLAANNLQNFSVIRAGQVLRIPGAKSTGVASTTKTTSQTPISTKSRSVNVETRKVGENTLFSLAKEYGTTVDAIKAENPGLNERKLRPEQIIRIPRSSSRPSVETVSTKKTPATTPTNTPEAKLTNTIKGIAPEELHPKQPAPVKPQPAPTKVADQRTITPASLPMAPSVPAPKQHDANDSVLDISTGNQDTWESLATRYNTTADDLRQRNPNLASSALIGGLTVRVPANKFAQEADLN